MDDKHDDVIEIDLLQILEVARKNIILFICIFVVMCAVGFAYSEFYLPKTFAASSKIIIVKDDNSLGASSTITYNDVQLSQRLVSTYSEILKSEAISDEVIRNLSLSDRDIGTKEYNDMVKISNADSTEVITIQVISGDPQLSAAMANEIVDVFISKVYDIMRIQNVSVLDSAKVPTEKHGPSITKYTAIGGAFGIMICVLIILLKIFTDRKVKTEDEVKAILNYPIIGTIPDFLDKEIEYDD